jgi:transcriptional regulator with GAF, ATPase, and Fis domain
VEAYANSSSQPHAVGAAHELIADQPTMDVLQSRYLQRVLHAVGGNSHRAAEVLGLNRRTVQRLIARYSLEATTEPEIEASSEQNTEPDDDLSRS